MFVHTHLWGSSLGSDNVWIKSYYYVAENIIYFADKDIMLLCSISISYFSTFCWHAINTIYTMWFHFRDNAIHVRIDVACNNNNNNIDFMYTCTAYFWNPDQCAVQLK